MFINLFINTLITHVAAIGRQLYGKKEVVPVVTARNVRNNNDTTMHFPVWHNQ